MLHPHQPDGKRDPTGEQNAREEIAAELVGAEQKHLAVLHAEQVEPAGKHRPQLVLAAGHEKTDRMLLRPVFGIDAPERLRIALTP